MRALPVPGSGDAIANYPPTQQVDTHTTHAPAASASPASARRRGSGARRRRQRGGARLRLGPPFRWAHVLLGILQSAPYAVLVLAEEASLFTLFAFVVTHTHFTLGEPQAKTTVQFALQAHVQKQYITYRLYAV